MKLSFVLHLNVVCNLIFCDLHTSHWGLPPYAESVLYFWCYTCSVGMKRKRGASLEEEEEYGDFMYTKCYSCVVVLFDRGFS